MIRVYKVIIDKGDIPNERSITFLNDVINIVHTCVLLEVNKYIN